jgi:pimeloyl-ACP methyl ester carboxylesterase
MTMSNLVYVLIPGAGGSAGYWHLVEAELRRRGHDVVAVDLPTEDDSAGLPEYTDAALDAIGDRTNLVLVGQSMGAFTATVVCERVPVSMLVLLNAMIPAPGETPGDWWANTGQAQAMREKDARDGRPTDADFDLATYFLHDVPQHVLDEPWAQARRQSDTPFGQPWPLEAWPDVPTRVVIGRDDRFFPAEFQRRLAQDRLGITADDVSGGHLVALSHPLELADRLEAYGAEVEAGLTRFPAPRQR